MQLETYSALGRADGSRWSCACGLTRWSCQPRARSILTWATKRSQDHQPTQGPAAATAACWGTVVWATSSCHQSKVHEFYASAGLQPSCCEIIIVKATDSVPNAHFSSAFCSWLPPLLAPPLMQQGLVTQWGVGLARLHSGGCLARLRRPGHRTCTWVWEMHEVNPCAMSCGICCGHAHVQCQASAYLMLLLTAYSAAAVYKVLRLAYKVLQLVYKVLQLVYK
ncbi:hypothetical protein HaLaN_32368, partial [Haematococcus lacustris]